MEASQEKILRIFISLNFHNLIFLFLFLFNACVFFLMDIFLVPRKCNKNKRGTLTLDSLAVFFFKRESHSHSMIPPLLLIINLSLVETLQLSCSLVEFTIFYSLSSHLLLDEDLCSFARQLECPPVFIKIDALTLT